MSDFEATAAAVGMPAGFQWSEAQDAPLQSSCPAQITGLHIPHWSEGLSHLPHAKEAACEFGHVQAIGAAISIGSQPISALNFQPLPGESRRDGEKRQWLESLALFTTLWQTRQDDTIACDHPLEDWVARQRKLYRAKKLMPWKRQLLTRMGFPFVAAREQATPDNMGYAQLLSAFHAEHGHYAPTQTIGGPGLTRWVRLMRESKGKMGMIGESAASAAAALAYLRLNITDFDLGNSVKREINLASGLSFNGFEKSAAVAHKPPTERSKNVLERVTAALDYPVDLRRLALLDQQSQAAIGLFDIARRAAFYRQALRVSVTPAGQPRGAPAQVWWLHGVSAVSASAPGRFTVQPANIALVLRSNALASQIQPVQTQTPVIEKTVACGYSSDGELYSLTLQCRDSSLLQIDYDALLADQTHVGVGPWAYLDNSQEGAFSVSNRTNWAGWSSGETRPAKLLGTTTTANVMFETNLRDLRCWFEHEAPLKDGRRSRQLDWSTSGLHYKFIEHMVLKVRQGNMQPSHAERLIDLGFTWGSGHAPAAELLTP